MHFEVTSKQQYDTMKLILGKAGIKSNNQDLSSVLGETLYKWWT